MLANGTQACNGQCLCIWPQYALCLYNNSVAVSHECGHVDRQVAPEPNRTEQAAERDKACQRNACAQWFQLSIDIRKRSQKPGRKAKSNEAGTNERN